MGAAWFVSALAWFLWRDYVLTHNVVAIACGYPDTAAKAYAPCMAQKLPIADMMMWHELFVRNSPWIAGPALVLVLAGLVLRGRVSPPPA